MIKKNKNKIIKLNINSGLCNRLRTIFYHHNRLEHDECLVVVWTWDESNAMPGEFYDYFEKIDDIKFVSNVDSPFFYRGNGCDLNWHLNDYRLLQPLPHITKIIQDESKKLNNDYIAVHVRRTDIKAVYDKYNEKYSSNYDDFDKFIKVHTNKNLYIATDNDKTYHYFNEKYKNNRKMNNNINFIQTSNRRKTSRS